VLLEHLQRVGRDDLLLDQERDLLAREDVKALPPAKQLAYLATNRRVGLWVTAFAGGVRVLLLGGGAVALLMMGEGELGATLGGSGLLIVTLWLTRALVRRLQALRRSLPSAAEIDLE
jgi:hypothetical protein